MSARLTEKEFHAVIESIQAEANISSRTGQMDRLLVAAATLERDRAAILESERDLRAALEHEHLALQALKAYIKASPEEAEAANHQAIGDLVNHAYELGRAAIANARKQDAPTGAGGGKQ